MLLIAAVDVHTPRQVMNKALRDNAFEHASARLGMPMTTALLNATMETVRVCTPHTCSHACSLECGVLHSD